MKNKQGALAFIFKQRRLGKTDSDISRMANQYNKNNKAITIKKKKISESEFNKRQEFFEEVDELILESKTVATKSAKQKELEEIVRFNWLD